MSQQFVHYQVAEVAVMLFLEQPPAGRLLSRHPQSSRTLHLAVTRCFVVLRRTTVVFRGCLEPLDLHHDAGDFHLAIGDLTVESMEEEKNGGTSEITLVAEEWNS